ncbi:MAG: hypothetical protein FE043_01540 [Thermoplasmata archaeon]|nr:MAG: hypothetical protein FE043_01540 [Thermoplasmata archaeon]
MGICRICGKPTTSHRIGAYFVCHDCWEKRKGEVEKLRTELKKKVEASLNALTKNEKDGMKLMGIVQKFALNFDDEIKTALKEYRYSVEDENRFIVFLNYFTFERELESRGKTPAELFMEEYDMPDWVAENIKKFQTPVKGFFEVKEVLPQSRFIVQDIFNKKEYLLCGEINLKKGDFIGDEIYPWEDVYLTGGAISLYTDEDAEKFLKMAEEFEKLIEKSIEKQKEVYSKFLEYFGKDDPVFDSIDSAEDALDKFTSWMEGGEGGKKIEEEKEGDIGIVCHPSSGIYVVPDYGKFKRMMEGREAADREYAEKIMKEMPYPVIKKLSEDKNFAKLIKEVFGKDITEENLDDFMKKIRPDW